MDENDIRDLLPPYPGMRISFTRGVDRNQMRRTAQSDTLEGRLIVYPASRQHSPRTARQKKKRFQKLCSQEIGGRGHDWMNEALRSQTKVGDESMNLRNRSGTLTSIGLCSIDHCTQNQGEVRLPDQHFRLVTLR